MDKLEKSAYWRPVIAIVLVIVAILSFTFLGDLMSSSDTYAATTASIQNRIDTVLTLTGSTAVASAAVSAIPGDTATPIAEKLADFSQYFLLVMCVLYAEKYLLGIIGLAAFRILIPAACLMFIYILFRPSPTMKKIATKLLILAAVLVVTIPLGVKISQMIDEQYHDSIEATISEAQDFSDLTAAFPDSDDGDDDSSIWDTIWSKFSETAGSLADKASSILQRMVEALAVMIVTSCVIPVLTLIFFVWFFKMLTGIDVRLPDMRHMGRPGAEKKE